MEKKVLYIYGYGSSPEGNTATWLKENLPNAKVYCKVYCFKYPQLDPNEAIPYLCKLVDDLDIDIIIGSSLGGWYGMHIASICGLPLIAINSLTDTTLVSVMGYVSNGDVHLCEKFLKYKNEHPLFSSKEHWTGYRWDDSEDGNYSVLVWSDDDEVIYKNIIHDMPLELKENFLTKYVVKNGKHQLTDKQKEEYLIPAYDKLVNEIIPKVDNFYKKTLIIP